MTLEMPPDADYYVEPLGPDDVPGAVHRMNPDGTETYWYDARKRRWVLDTRVVRLLVTGGDMQRVTLESARQAMAIIDRRVAAQKAQAKSKRR